MNSIILFLATCNTLLPFPLDKAIMIIYVFYCIYKYKITNNLLIIVSTVLLLEIMVYLINLLLGKNVSFLIFFPIFGILFVYYVSKYIKIDDLKKALYIHIIFSIFLLIKGYIIRDDSRDVYVHYMYDKGLPFLAAPMGFTSTVQAYGTLLLSYIILTIKENKKKNVLFVICFLLLIMTFNRATYLNLIVYFVLNNPNMLIIPVFIVVIFFIIKPDIIKLILGTIGTLKSRLNAILIVIEVIINSNLFNFFLGNSNTLITDLPRTMLIENGILQLIYTYGLLFYIILVFSFIIWFFFVRSKVCVVNKMYIIYIICFAQILTHEYFSTTLYFLLSVLFMTSNRKNSYVNNL